MIQNILLNRSKPRPVSDNILHPDAILQWWYFDAVLENRYRLVTFLMPKLPWIVEDNNYPLNEPMSLFEIILRKPDGENIQERQFLNHQEIKPVPNAFGAVFGNEGSFTYDNPPDENHPGCYCIRYSGVTAFQHAGTCFRFLVSVLGTGYSGREDKNKTRFANLRI